MGAVILATEKPVRSCAGSKVMLSSVLKSA